MNKVICEMCGTIYPDTADCCPTCGTAKPESVGLTDIQETDAPRDYQPTRGGRFSNSNVRKRLKNTKGTAPAPASVPRKPRTQAPRQERPEPRQERTASTGKKRSGSNTGLVVTAIVLLLAIVGMLIYIYVNFFMPPAKPQDPAGSTEQTGTQGETFPPQTQGTTAPPDLSCTGLLLSENSIVLKAVGNGWLLNPIPTPANTDDPITFASADETVATVSAEGNVVAVGPGETVITVTCGDITAECKVVCDITPPEETDPPESETTQPQQSTFQLNRTDITFSSQGETWLLYDGDIPLTDIQWSVGNSAVATVTNGKVKAVGPGQTKVKAVYNGQEVTCIIRCNFS